MSLTEISLRKSSGPTAAEILSRIASYWARSSPAMSGGGPKNRTLSSLLRPALALLPAVGPLAMTSCIEKTPRNFRAASLTPPPLLYGGSDGRDGDLYGGRRRGAGLG